MVFHVKLTFVLCGFVGESEESEHVLQDLSRVNGG